MVWKGFLKRYWIWMLGSLGFFLVFASLPSDPYKKDSVKLQSSNPTPQLLPLTRIVGEEKDWELVSDWQTTRGSKTLYTAEAHKPGEDPSIHHQVFLEIFGCAPGSVSVRNRDKKVEVTIVETRTFGTNTVVAPNTGIAGSNMVFVTPRCF